MLIDYIKAKEDLTIVRPIPMGNMSLEAAIKEMVNFVSKEQNSKIALDLSKIDYFSAVQIGVVILTRHFIAHLDKKFIIIVQDRLIQKSIESLNLDNARLVYNDGSLALSDIA